MARTLPSDETGQGSRPAGADAARGRRVAALCDTIFAATGHVHGLTKTCRPLLRAAALLSPGEPLEGRGAPGLGAGKRKIVQRAAELHARDSRAVRALAAGWGANGEASDQIAVRLDAILRLADGLDRRRTRKAHIAAIADDGQAVAILVAGDEPTAEGAALADAELWNAVMQRPVRVVGVREDAPVASTGLIEPSQSLAEAVRAIAQRQLEQFTARTYGLRYGRDIEFVHEMRVALRRLRAALRLFRKALGKAGRALNRELKWFGTELGVVRDLDVFLAYLRSYFKKAPKEHVAALRGPTRSLQANRRWHHGRLLDVSETGRYNEFTSVYCPLVRRPVGSDAGLVRLDELGATPIWRQAPAMLAKQWNKVARHDRRLERLSSQEQHALRIECKRLRYTAEFFADLYPGRLAEIVKPMVRMQDALGDVHDADVYTERVGRFRKRWGRKPEDEAVGDAGVALLSHLEQGRRTSLTKASATWRAFNAPKSARRLAELIHSPLEG